MNLNNKAFIFDLDGTIYRGEQAVPGAVDFVQHLKRNNIPYAFFTNRSVRPPEAITDQLQSFGMDAKPEQIFTAALTTADYIGNANVYMIGEGGLKRALEQQDARFCQDHDETADFVVIGFDQHFNMQKLTQAIRLIDAGAKCIASNADTHMIENGKRVPANGAIIAAIETAACISDTLICGKPNPMIVDFVKQRMGWDQQDLMLVGDNLNTDIACGNQAGIKTVLMMTGVTTPDMAETSSIKADYQASDYAALMDVFEIRV